jgi:hypothetical protein
MKLGSFSFPFRFQRPFGLRRGSLLQREAEPLFRQAEPSRPVFRAGATLRLLAALLNALEILVSNVSKHSPPPNKLFFEAVGRNY